MDKQITKRIKLIKLSPPYRNVDAINIDACCNTVMFPFIDSEKISFVEYGFSSFDIDGLTETWSPIAN